MANLPKGMGGMGGGMGGPGMMKMIADMKRKLEEDAVKMQETLETAEFEGSAGGVVKATANGHGQLLSLSIAKEAVDPDDVETLQEMVLIAVREALEKAEATREEEQKKLMPAGIPGMNIPGLF